MLIAIEGCVGVGKTTVAEGLAKRRGSSILLEDFESNPFLQAFYANPEDTALETEFGFLLLHFHQLKRIATNASTCEFVSDFHLWKDLVYADLNLTDTRVSRLFSELYEILLEQAPLPRLMIFLSASTDLIIDRIQGRQREFELKIDIGYFARVNSAYEAAIAQYPGRKLCVPMDKWDFVRAPDLFDELNLLIDQELGPV